MRSDKDKLVIRLIRSLQESAFIHTDEQRRNKPEVCMGSNHQAAVRVYYLGSSNYCMRIGTESVLFSK